MAGTTATPEELKNMVQGMSDGTLPRRMKLAMKNVTTGILVGAGAGFFISTLTGSCKLCLTFWGALGGAAIGYLQK
jgi:F0F1-type ATP synthase assembly protein I